MKEPASRSSATPALEKPPWGLATAFWPCAKTTSYARFVFLLARTVQPLVEPELELGLRLDLRCSRSHTAQGWIVGW